MEDNKLNKRIKNLTVMAVVLFLSIIGVSTAYYLARVQGNLNGRAAGTELELTITKLSTSASDDLIPLDNDLETLNLAAKGYENNGACIDINGYSVCQIYKVTLTNNGSAPITVNGTVELYGDNTPNIECAKMDDESTITDSASCMGNNNLANNVELPANNHTDYYVMVYIKNLDEPQYDSGEFNGTVTFTSIDGKKVKGRFKKEETMVEHITNLYNNADKTVVTAKSDSSDDTKTLDYNYAPSVNLMNDRLGGTTESLDGGNIRYYGENPNNYIDFGDKYNENYYRWQYIGAKSAEVCLNYPNESLESCNDIVYSAEDPMLWRIIGVFDGKVRIIRDQTIGLYSWDTSASDVNGGGGINQWGSSGSYQGADLMKLLNPGYANNKDLNENGEIILVNNSLYYNKKSGTCYNGQSNATKQCDFTNTGLSESVKNKIVDQTFNLGAESGSNKYVNEIYIGEKNSIVDNNPNDGVTRTTSWTGKVGLMYPSDYGYAADLNKCGELKIFQYYKDQCNSNVWLDIKADQWFISASVNDNRRGWALDRVSALSTVSSAYMNQAPLNIHPVVTLASWVKIESGTGTKDDPYVVAD